MNWIGSSAPLTGRVYRFCHMGRRGPEANLPLFCLDPAVMKDCCYRKTRLTSGGKNGITQEILEKVTAAMYFNKSIIFRLWLLYAIHGAVLYHS